MRIMGHLLLTTVRTFWHIVLTAVLCAALAAAVVVVVAEASIRQWPPSLLTEVAAGAVALLAAYAGGLTVLLGASVRGLLDAAKLVEKEAVAPVKAVEQELEGRTR